MIYDETKNHYRDNFKISSHENELKGDHYMKVSNKNEKRFWPVSNLCSCIMYAIKTIFQRIAVFAGYKIMPADGIS